MTITVGAMRYDTTRALFDGTATLPGPKRYRSLDLNICQFMAARFPLNGRSQI